MTTFDISCIGTAIVSSLIGLFVFFFFWRESINQRRALFCFSVAIWSLGLGMMTSATDVGAAKFWIKIHNFGAILIAPFFMDFVFKLIGHSHKNAVWSAYSFALVLE